MDEQFIRRRLLCAVVGIIFNTPSIANTAYEYIAIRIPLDGDRVKIFRRSGKERLVPRRI
jgi:hypothetical protein